MLPLNPEQVGLSLAEKSVDVYDVDGVEVISRWYHSPQDSDFMLWLSGKGQIIRFQLNVYGQVVDWSASHGLRTGFIFESEWTVGEPEKGDYEVSETIRFDDTVNRETVYRARDIVHQMTCLAEEWRMTVDTHIGRGLGQRVKLEFWARIGDRLKRAGARILSSFSTQP